MCESSVMTLIGYSVFLVSFVIFCTNTYNSAEIASWAGQAQLLGHADYFRQPQGNANEKVKIQLFYESLCPDCRNFDSGQFKQVVLQLNKYLNIFTYPYGNAQTNENNGKYTFRCQHGPTECYGNKLHACALSIIENHEQALLYNSCMMDYSQTGRGSDDRAADLCGSSMRINSESIKACAKSERGSELLKYYGDESKRANFHYVPYILVNGKESDGSHFMRDVCAAYANPPPPCAQIV